MAQKLKFGNGTFATKEGSTLAYNDESNNFKPLPFSFTRDSIATRVNKEGLIEVVGNDKPRIDYTDSADGVLLLENSATNLVTYSEDYNQSSWVKLGAGSGSAAIITSDYAISPDGTQNASRLQCNLGGGTSSSSQSLIYDDVIVSAGDTTRSIYVKSNDSNTYDVYFGATLSSYEIKEVTSEWTRIDATRNVASSGSDYLTIGLRGGTGSGDTADILIYGAMLEQNSFATSYIPTSGSSVQRAAETCNGAGNSEVFNDSEGVLFFNLNTFDTSSVPVFSLSDGTFSNEIEFAYYGTNQWNVISRVGGVNTSVVGTVDGDAYSKFSVSYTSSSFKVFLNGFLIGSNTMASAFSGLKQINFSYPDEANPFYGKTKEIGYYDALTDAELETLTSYRSLNELVTELNLNTL